MERAIIVGAILASSGVAIACTGMLPLPVPPIPISVTWTDVARQVLAGHGTNAIAAAAYSKLDGYATRAVGEEKWIKNEFIGIFSYRGPDGIGSGIVTVHKPCGQKAVDVVDRPAPEPQPDQGGGSGHYDYFYNVEPPNPYTDYIMNFFMSYYEIRTGSGHAGALIPVSPP